MVGRGGSRERDFTQGKDQVLRRVQKTYERPQRVSFLRPEPEAEIVMMERLRVKNLTEAYIHPSYRIILQKFKGGKFYGYKKDVLNQP